MGCTAAACGIPLEDEPRDLATELPAALSPGQTTTTEPPSLVETVRIYLARDSGDGTFILEAVDRDIEPDGSVNTVLQQVLAGPDVEEQALGLVSPLTEDSSLVGTALVDDVLQIQLDSLDGFPVDDSASQQLAFAMLVCTATELIPGIEVERVQVLVDRDGEFTPVNMPVSNGEPPEEGAPVACTNYADFDPLLHSRGS